MHTHRGFRISAILIALFAVFSLSAVDTAEARMGGSFGSRGSRTYQSVPATPTSPRITAPVQRSMTNGSTVNRGTAYAPGASVNRPGWFGGLGGLGGWMLGGLLFSGLFGMMFGGGLGGFGGFGGMFSLLIQLGILFFVVRWLMNRFGRSAPATGPGGGSYSYAPPPRQDWSPGAGYGSSNASQRAGSRDEIGISNADLGTFEQRLSQLQDAYSREDFDALRRIVTPEVMSYLTEELAQSAAKGLRNEVFDVKLLSGDVAEAWREGDAEYATAALRYESRDVMRERATGRLVSGDENISQKSEVWTFVRDRGGPWLVSAIQE